MGGSLIKTCARGSKPSSSCVVRSLLAGGLQRLESDPQWSLELGVRIGIEGRVNILHRKEASGRFGQKLGPYQIESLIPPEEEGQLTAYCVRIEPRQSTSESYHKLAEELYYVLQGEGWAYLDGVERRLEAGDFLRLPPGTRHRFVTEEQALVMLDIHSPGSRPDRDVYFTDTVPEGFGN